jgi:arylsulfatase
MKCFWFAAALVLATLNGTLTSSLVFADDRPNILLIMADDLGFSDVGCFGSEIQTPHIDSIARDGLQFTRFRATPMCVTSRIALMSGMPMHRAGQHNY